MTQLREVSIQQTIGWSQIEVSLALILACAPMCAKLVVHPLIDVLKFPIISQPDNDAFSISEEKRKLYNKDLPKTPEDAAEVPRTQTHVAKLEVQEDRVARIGRPDAEDRRLLRSKDAMVVRDIKSTEFRKLKIKRASVNGQVVWEVRKFPYGLVFLASDGY